MRDTSLTFRQAVNAQETNELFIVLLEISHSSLADPIRINNSGASITSNGNTYVFYPFTINLPSDEDKQLPEAELVIDNVDLQQIAAIRGMSSSPSIRIMVVLQSDPNTIEVDFPNFTLSSVTYDAMTITGTLSIDDFMMEPFPGGWFVPSDFPAAF
jgi:hypothetical protein